MALCVSALTDVTTGTSRYISRKLYNAFTARNNRHHRSAFFISLLLVKMLNLIFLSLFLSDHLKLHLFSSNSSHLFMSIYSSSVLHLFCMKTSFMFWSLIRCVTFCCNLLSANTLLRMQAGPSFVVFHSFFMFAAGLLR